MRIDTNRRAYRRRAMLAAVLLALPLWAAPSAVGRTIPEDRRMAWRPGVEGGIPTYAVTLELRTEDLPAGGDANAAPVIQRAIDQAPAPGAVLLPEGTFHLKEGLRMRGGVVLRGRGLDRTSLVFDVPRLGVDPGTWGQGVIAFNGQWAGEELTILGGYEAGSKELLLETTAGLAVGQMVRIDSDNDLQEMYGSPTYGSGNLEKEWMRAGRTYARRVVRQTVRIVEIRDRSLVLDVPVRLSRMHLNPRLRPIDALQWAGVESLRVTRLDTAPGVIVRFALAENCWMRDCETHRAHQAHVSLGGRFLTLESNYIHDAHHFRGGHGYGVSGGSDCLVWNNVFRRLRHAMVSSNGANGNVWAYNYSSEQDQDGTHRLRDISVHGHYPYMELFEGNVAEFATSSDWWGAAGPLITFFRNRFDTTLNHKPGGWNAPLQIMNGSHRQNVIGNSMVSGQGIQVMADSRDAMVEGNLVQGQVVWTSDPMELPPSLFLDGPPHFWGDLPWPAIGADADARNAPRYTKIPAQTWGERIQARGRAMPFSISSTPEPSTD